MFQFPEFQVSSLLQSNDLTDQLHNVPYAFPDYEQRCEDHCKVIVLVQAILGPEYRENGLEQKLLTLLRESHPSHTLISAEEGPKTYQFRYLTKYPVENNGWADFQRHRGVFALIYLTDVEENVALKNYETLRVSEFFARSLFPF